jgi:hypothetical protein
MLVAPNLAVTVQPAIVTGPDTSDGGPTYYTEAETNAAIAAAILGLAPAAKQADLTPSGAVSTTLFAATFFSLIRVRIVPGAGSGAYTAAYSLPDASQTEGAICKVNIAFPASANPTITLTDGAGDPIAVITNTAPSAPQWWYGEFEFDGIAWWPTFAGTYTPAPGRLTTEGGVPLDTEGGVPMDA